MHTPFTWESIALFFLLVFPTTSYRIDELWTDVRIQEARNEAEAMFWHAFNGYLRNASPMDELKPLSCKGSNSYGGMALTLMESLDTLLILGDDKEFNRAVEWISGNVHFDLDIRINVFEASIRILGSLLSAHLLILDSRRNDSNVAVIAELEGVELAPGYDNELLNLAFDLGQRLLPAFTTESDIPFAWVNLRHGLIPEDVTDTCTAGAGTFMLEFGILSRLTGHPIFEEKAKASLRALFNRRSGKNLLGNTIDSVKGSWIQSDSGAGPGIDSYYEYLLKSYLLFGDEEMLSMFTITYSAAMAHLRVNDSRIPWIIDADMDSGAMSRPWVSSLQAFWPGMQVLSGDVDSASKLQKGFWTVWKRFSFLPELFDLSGTKVHQIQQGYPLRPEFIESSFFLFKATGDHQYLNMGLTAMKSIQKFTRTECGYASVGNVVTRFLDDHMESFFLSETVKYLILLFSPKIDIAERFIFSTEGHLYPLHLIEKTLNPNPTPLNPHKTPDSESPPKIGNVRHPSIAHRRSVVFSALKGLQGVGGLNPSPVEGVKAVLEIQNVGRTVPLHVGKVLGSLTKVNGDESISCRFSLDMWGNLFCAVWTSGTPWKAYGEVLLARMQFVPESSIVPGVGPTWVVRGAGTDQSPFRCSIGLQNSHLAQREAIQALRADFGPQLEAGIQLEGEVALAQPPDACQKIENEAEVGGRVTVVLRGGCSFVDKALNVQEAGGTAVLVGDTSAGRELIVMGSDRPLTPSLVQIPSLFISHSDKLLLENEPSFSPPPSPHLCPMGDGGDTPQEQYSKGWCPNPEGKQQAGKESNPHDRIGSGRYLVKIICPEAGKIQNRPPGNDDDKVVEVWLSLAPDCQIQFNEVSLLVLKMVKQGRVNILFEKTFFSAQEEKEGREKNL